MIGLIERELRALRVLLPLLAAYRWPTVGLVLLGILAALAEGLGIGLMIPLLQSAEHGQALGTGMPFPLNVLAESLPPEQRMAALALLMVGLVLLKVALAYLYVILVAWLKNHLYLHLRTALFRQLLTVAQEFMDTQTSGTLLNTLNQGVEQVTEAVLCLLWIVVSLCHTVVFATILLYIALPLTLVALPILLLLSLLVHFITSQVRHLGRHQLDAANQLSQLAKEVLLGSRTVRAFGHETYEIDRFTRLSQHKHRLSVRQSRIIAIAHPLTEGLAASVLIGLVYVSLQIGIGVSTLITMVFLLYRLQPQIQNINHNLTLIRSLSAAVETVQSLLNTADKPYLLSGNVPFVQPTTAIRFENVAFTYPGQAHPALQGLTLTIPAGQTTAFVGASGAGKSTLLHLLCRFYDPTDGQITVDGVPLPALVLADWRQHLALVSQDVQIFSGTVRANIAYGRLEASEADIIAAARQAHAHEFISELPLGYDTLVGDRGMRLSGGQRQRLSIARAILRDPAVLLLDEATNALDSISEAHIQEALAGLSRNRTVVVVAHRLSTIERADQIVVLDGGRVVEQGRFAELLAREGAFAALYRAQSGLAESSGLCVVS